MNSRLVTERESLLKDEKNGFKYRSMPVPIKCGQKDSFKMHV